MQSQNQNQNQQQQNAMPQWAQQAQQVQQPQQPQWPQPMQPQSQPHPVQFPAIATGQNKWSTGLFNCTDDVDGCLEVFACGRCQGARQYSMLTQGTTDLHWGALLGPLVADILIGMPIMTMAGAFYLRNRVRRRYMLEGNDLEDALVATCCTACSLCQNYREMAVRGEWPGACCAKAPDTAIPMGVEASGHDGSAHEEVAMGTISEKAPLKTV